MTSYSFKTVIVLAFVVIYCRAQSINRIGSDSSTAISVESLPDSTISKASKSSIKPVMLYSAGAILTTAILFHYDQNIYDGLQKWRNSSKIVKDLSPIITNLGDGTVDLGLFAGFVGYGLINKDKKAVEVGKIGVESWFLTGVTVQLLKQLCGRERPSAATRPGGFWYGPFAFFRQPNNVNKGGSSFDSFPSGHTTTAFAAATTISDFYTDSWVSYTSYSLATLVAISRVIESTHWLSDCFVGAIIGHYGTRLIEKMNYGSTDLTITPWVNNNRYGLILCIKL